MDVNQLLALLGTYGNLNDEAARKAAQAAGFNVTARQRREVQGDQYVDIDDPSLGYQAFADLGGGKVFRAYVDPSTGALVEPTTYKTGFSGLGRFVQQVAPLAAMATLGGMMVPGVLGGAAAEAGAAAPAASGGMSMMPGAGISLPAGVSPGMTSLAGMSHMPGTLGAYATEAGLLGGAAGAGLGAGAAAAGAAPIVESVPSWVSPQAAVAPAAVAPAASPSISQILSGARSAASVAGPLVSLAGGLSQVASLPQVPEAPRVPGVEAPPEARGYQAGRPAILDVLQRNQRANRNRTLLTGPGGVNMESVRVGANTLLGLASLGRNDLLGY
ncbi:MAG: hypothetical protein KJ011_03250 [Burkholderiaceae bacterium]|nr:hypothetical protein [Burkholderiaceae bacterium]